LLAVAWDRRTLHQSRFDQALNVFGYRAFQLARARSQSDDAHRALSDLGK
jgi:hypothetical protein